MAEKGPPAPTPKPGKTKIPVAKQMTAKTNDSLGTQNNNKTYRLSTRSECTTSTKSTGPIARSTT